MLDGQVRRVFRLKDGLFQQWKQGRWQESDYLERATQDPDFVEIGKREADVLIRYVGVGS